MIGLGEDKVIFTSIPFDVYYYTILSSPDSSQIGETISINVPREPDVYHQNTDYYNTHVYGDALKIDTSILQHSIGDPFSYANSTDKFKKMTDHPEGMFSGEQIVGISDSGSTSTLIGETITITDTYAYTLTVTLEAEVTAASITAGVSAGYKYGYTYETSVTTGIYIEGEVPDIPGWKADEGYPLYKWGLMSYPMEVEESNQKFTVVTYWVY